MSNVLVTGGGGFIGQAVMKRLEEIGYSAHSFDLSAGQDIRKRDDLLEAARGVDKIIHMAGVLGTHELFDAPYQAVQTNVLGTLNVLEACRERECGYVGILMPDVFPSIYTATKVAASRLATAYHHTHQVPVSHVRAFNAFGPGQAHGPGHPQKIVPTFAVQAWRKEALPVWGDGEQTVDLIHTDDLARLLVDAMQYEDDQVFDGGTGEDFTVNQVATMVMDHCDGGFIQYLPMRRGERPVQLRAAGEGWDLLGWKPEFRMQDLRDTIDSYQDPF